MIEITDQKDCCGCSACAQACPEQCIQMKNVAEGFIYPWVDRARCIDCGLCNRVCPMLNLETAHLPVKVYAAKNMDEETRLQSSSGGVFTLFAERVVSCGGVVFGASFDDDWQVIHTYAENRQELEKFRGSKYVQSWIGTSFIDAKSFLKQGREVLFSGTPCQIAGLKKFLGKEYSNLFTVEILCHGVPSPKAWQSYLNSKKKDFRCNGVRRINFRDKKNGWLNYGIMVEFTDGQKYERPRKQDPFLRSFVQDLCLRPSCYACKCKHGRSNSDMTIADYWNIDNVLPAYNDGKGISLVLVYTEKGFSLLASVATAMDCVETPYESCTAGNRGFEENIPVRENRTEFFRSLVENGSEGVFPVKDRMKYRIMDRLGIRCLLK